MSKVRKRLHQATLLDRLGPGVITGAADDDPSGIATYSQAGAQFGLQMLWTMVLCFPLMSAVQGVCARIGRVTGQGLAANLKEAFPGPWAAIVVAFLFTANAINIGADLAAMGEAAQLVIGRGGPWLAAAFGLLSLLLQVFVPYHRYVRVLKWLTLALFAYVGVVLVVKVDWPSVLLHMVWPRLPHTREAVTLLVAIFGTTISPYLFFWQSSQEVEEIKGHADKKPLLERPDQAPEELSRIRLDTYVGMAFSNLISIAIMISTAVTLHAHGVTDVQTASQAAEALRPVAGDLAFGLFAMGIIGTGLLAVPVLAGSTAYAMAEVQGWRFGLELKPAQALGFYSVIAASIAVGVALGFSPIDPIKALFWSAVINGLVAPPIMAVMMLVASSRKQMGAFVASRNQKILGWAATAVMGFAAVVMLIYAWPGGPG